MPAQPARDREHRRDHRAARAGQLRATVVPGGPEAERLLDRGDATLAHPAGGWSGIGRQAVDVVEGQARIGDRLQTRVDGEGQRIAHQTAPDLRTSDTGEHHAVLEARAARGRPRRRALRFGDAVDRVGLPGRREEREPHVVVLLEAHRHDLADRDVLRFAVDDVRGEVHRGVLGERDVRDHVGRLEPGKPLVTVDRVADDGGAARHLGRCPRAAAARGADGHRWVHELAAVGAALDAQSAVGTGRPEPLVHQRELRERSHLLSRSIRARRRARASPRPPPPAPYRDLAFCGE